MLLLLFLPLLYFFFTHPPTPVFYTLSLHDALPISARVRAFPTPAEVTLSTRCRLLVPLVRKGRGVGSHVERDLGELLGGAEAVSRVTAQSTLQVGAPEKADCHHAARAREGWLSHESERGKACDDRDDARGARGARDQRLRA